MPATNLCATSHRLLTLMLTSLLASALLTLPDAAFAQESPVDAAPSDAIDAFEDSEESAEESAARLAEEATGAFERGEVGRAADLLERARQLHPDPVYTYNQILAYKALKRPAYALELLQENAEVLGQDGRFAELDILRAELEQAAAGRDAPAEPASQSPEFKGDSPTEAATIEAPPEVEEASPNVLAWSLVGAGGVAIGAGVLFGSGLLLTDTVDRLERSRAPGSEPAVYEGIAHTRDDDLRQLRTHQTLNVVLVAGGVSLGVAGATMLFLDRRADRPHPHALRLTPLLSGEHAGALLRGQF